MGALASASAAVSLAGCAGGANEQGAGVEYVIDDGIAEKTLAIDPGEDQVWLTTFPVEPGGEVIDLICIAFGRPGGPSALDGMRATVLLYEDADGGSPQNAKLILSKAITITGANTAALMEAPIPPTRVSGHVVVGVHFRNVGGVQKGIGAVDLTPPTHPGRCWGGWANEIDPANLGAIPGEQFKTIEDWGLPGAFVLRARGRTGAA